MDEPVISFYVLAEIERVDVDKAAPRYLMMSECHNHVAMARREGDRLIQVAGPYSLELIDRLAQNVLAGNSRASTWPEALNALALFVSAFVSLYRRDALRSAAETSGAETAPIAPAPEPAPPACDCTPDARAVPPTHESLFTCTPCGG